MSASLKSLERKGYVSKLADARDARCKKVVITRKGLDAAIPGILAQMSPRRIVYVSCDPATLARDLAELEKYGYSAQRAQSLDLFPRCAHVETVVLLSKGEIDSKKVQVEFSPEDREASDFQ